MENNTVLKGENRYYGIPSFKLNATINAQSIKNKLLNMLSDFYTNNIMANMRGYIAQFNPSLRNSYRTNNAFTETELNALRQAVYNHEYEKKLKDYKYLLQKYGRDVGLQDWEIAKRLGNSISYENYAPVYIPTEYKGRQQTNINSITRDGMARFKNEYRHKGSSNYRNASLPMQGTIGAADYYFDKNGDVILTDKYDFTQDSILSPDSVYKIPALIAKFAQKTGIATPYNTKINLGNPNTWNFNYTGNNKIEQLRELENGELKQDNDTLDSRY